MTIVIVSPRRTHAARPVCSPPSRGRIPVSLSHPRHPPPKNTANTMPPSPSRQNSAKIADVLEVVQNPMTPDYAKQQTLRKLDGLDSRRMSASGRRKSFGQSDAIVAKEKFRRSNSEATSSLQRGADFDTGFLYRSLKNKNVLP